ncbi:MAG: hypothetical protein Q8L41_01990 [Anaerolineales bacterium]|nr:hypothetical protein [Anaerolineales bacterium]
MLNKNQFSKPLIYIALIAYIILSYVALGSGNQVLVATIPEDHYFESVGALSFFVSSVLFFFAFLRARKVQGQNKVFWIKQWVCLGLSFFFFFGAGEEISWGQRIFNVETPESINTINDQGEITVHNLSFGGVNIPFETMFDLFWMSFVVAIPIAVIFIKPFGRFVGKFVPIIHWAIGLLFVFNYLWAKIAKIIYFSSYNLELIPFRQAVQEVKEGNYGVLFVLVALFVFVDMISLDKKDVQH